jgi:hypothetical protein
MAARRETSARSVQGVAGRRLWRTGAKWVTMPLPPHPGGERVLQAHSDWGIRSRSADSPCKVDVLSVPTVAVAHIRYTWDVDETQHVIYRGGDGHIHELWYSLASG